MTDIFDDLPGIFTDPNVFGEAVDYTPAGGATRRINAVWNETSGDEFPLASSAASDIGMTTLAVMATDLVPAEGDVATRVKTGRTMNVATPIKPDGKGMIVAALADQS